LHFDKLNVQSKVEGLKAFPARSRNKALSSIEGLKASDRAKEARRNGLEPALSMSKGTPRDQKFRTMPAWFYILRLESGNLYIGSTTDLGKRYEDHCRGRACRTTGVDPPSALIYSEEYETFSEARKREAQVKRWSRAKKEALASGDLTALRKLAKSK
jgi:putative endonuclease